MLPIHFAAMFNRLDVVAMLLDRGSYLQQPPAKRVSNQSISTASILWQAFSMQSFDVLKRCRHAQGCTPFANGSVPLLHQCRCTTAVGHDVS